MREPQGFPGDYHDSAADGQIDDCWFILAVIAALFFYWLRDNHRAAYGLSEIAVGLAILAARFILPGPVLLAIGGGSGLNELLTGLVVLFTGIYAIVRGLDNIIGEVRRH